MRALPASLVCALLLPCGACKIAMRLPAEFLQLEHAVGYQAVTADDARVWVRQFADPDEGSVDFWTGALKEDLLRNRGYQLVDQGTVRDAAGREGRWLQCTATVDGERFGYLSAVFVLPGGWFSSHGLFTDNKVRVCEFTAREELFARHLEAVRAAIATLAP
jgi:hypothetical protein